MDIKDKKCIICETKLNKNNITNYRLKNYIYKCNDCMRKEKRMYARGLPNHIKNQRAMKHRKKMNEENPKRYTCIQMSGAAKGRARKLNLDFNITSDYLLSIAPDMCPVFNKKLKYGRGDKTKMSASLDRIDNNEGYIIGNVQIISYLGNLMKNEANIGELKQFSDWIIMTIG